MYPGPFDYHRPDSLSEAVDLLARLGDEGKVLAGGQSLIPLMKHRLLAPAHLVDIKGIPGLDTVEQSDGRLVLGALTRHRVVERMALPAALAILHDATSVIADVQVRNRGTVGGSLAQADAGGDWAPVLLALDAAVGCVSASGERRIPVRNWFLDAYATALEPGEVVRDIALGVPHGRSGGAYVALKRRAGDFAIASAAVQLMVEVGGRCTSIGIGLGNVGLTPIHAGRAEDLLRGERIDASAVEEATAAVMEAVDPVSDLHGPSEYRREVVGVLFRRALQVAQRRISGERVNVLDYV